MAYGSDETESLSLVHLEKPDIDGSGRRSQKKDGVLHSLQSLRLREQEKPF